MNEFNTEIKPKQNNPPTPPSAPLPSAASADRLPLTTLSAIRGYVDAAMRLGYSHDAIQTTVRRLSAEHERNDAAFISALFAATRNLEAYT